ncbi:MAG: PulJ/GspJ family protein [Luteolibacter sp.]
MKISPKAALHRGFTILELMVAMAITAIIVGVLVTITGTAIDTWNNSRNELRAARQAEAMINIMTRDLESLVVRADRPQEWLSAVLKTPENGGSTNAARLIFLTAATDRYDGKIGTDDDLGGDISCVAYELEWKDPVSPESTPEQQKLKTFVINRHIANPNTTFQKVLGVAGTVDPVTGNEQTLDDVYIGAYGALMDQDRNFVCENIFQFTMTFHVDYSKLVAGVPTRDTKFISLSTDASGNESFRVKHNGLLVEPEDKTVVNGVLTAVEVSLTVLTDSAIVQLRQKLRTDPTWVGGQGRDKEDFPAWLKANSYNFTRLVQVPRK